MAGLDRHRAADVEIEPFPEIEARIGENPARFLDRELVERGPKHTTTSWRELFLARVRGIGKIAVANTWIEVERDLAARQERAPRESVKQVLRARVNYLVENGETHLQDLSIEELHSLSEDHTISDEGDEVGPVWQHTPCDSTDVEQESSMAWFCHNCRQRTNRVEKIDPDELPDENEPELVADGGVDETGRDHWNYGEEYEVKVQPTHEWQVIDCPACPHEFRELIRPGGAIAASLCPECWARIIFDRGDGRDREETTEQTTLIPDGGTDPCDGYREMPPEEEVIEDLVARGIARPAPEHNREGQTCLRKGCDTAVPESSYKTMNIGATAGYCSTICYMEDLDEGRAR